MGKYGRYLPVRVPAAHYCKRPLFSGLRRTNLWQCATCDKVLEYRDDAFGKGKNWYDVGVTHERFQVEWTKQMKKLSRETWTIVCEQCDRVETSNPVDAYHRGWRLSPWLKNQRVTCGQCGPRRWLWWLIIEILVERR